MSEIKIEKQDDGLFRARVTVGERTRTFSEFSTYESAMETAERAEQMVYSETLKRCVTIPEEAI